MDKTKHKSIKYVQGLVKASMLVNEPRFYKYTELCDEFFEVEMRKQKISLDLPIQVGFTILQLAKLHMLRFYYNCLDKYLDRSSFCLTEMDTDSAYFSLSELTIEEAMKPEMLEKHNKQIFDNCNDKPYLSDGEDVWFVRRCCAKHTKHDQRSPGLMKLEYNNAQKMISLNSKCYVIEKGEEYKLSCKGVNASRFSNPVEKFTQVLNDRRKVKITNAGMRAHGKGICSYTQEKVALNYTYIKRNVLSDGIHTEPLDIVLRPCKKTKLNFD